MKRPGIITAFCVLGYLSVVITFPQVFSPAVKKLGVFMPALYGILVAANFMSCVGIWYFKQWGVRLYLISFFAKTLFFILTNQIGISFYMGLVFSVLFSVFLLRYYSRMNANL
ncbi:MAG: hypothetical protein PSX36_10340 [bacterium]|nr:hypothetical protein [bacterium]